MATPSSILAWRISWTEEPGGLQFMGSQTWDMTEQLACSLFTLRITVVQYNSWYTGAGIEWTGKKSYSLGEEEEVRDGRADRWSATGHADPGGGVGHSTARFPPWVRRCGLGVLSCHHSFCSAALAYWRDGFHFGPCREKELKSWSSPSQKASEFLLCVAHLSTVCMSVEG